MSTTFVYRWERHEILEGRCLKCGVPYEFDGYLCIRRHQGTRDEDMRFWGNLEHADDCI